MSGLCQNCAWWTGRRPVPPNSKWDGWGSCELAGGTDGRPDYKESLAWAHDAESYAASLFTRHDFGCVQFKAMEGDNGDT